MITLHAYWVAWQTLRTTQGIERAKLRLFLVGTGIAYAGGTTLFLQGFRVQLPSFGVFLVLAYVIMIGFLVYRYHFLDLPVVIIGRAFVYSLLIATITATYLVAVLIMEKGFQGFFGYRSLVASAFVAFLIALFFNPLRDRIQAFVDRALFTATPPELAEQREQLLTEVRQTERMREVATLAAGLAHEVKNPLTAIKAFTEALGTRYGEAEFRARFQRIVGTEVERINHIVQQLLDFAKPVPPKLAPVDIARLLDETFEFLNSTLLEHRIEVVRRYGGAHQVLADPQQLRQVFLNLVLNSLAAMDGQGGRIEVATRPRGGELEVTIADTGWGIAPEHLPHVFDPFFTTKPTGTGLGLAVAHGIVQEHQGRIAIASTPGQGTMVRVSLPLAISL